jgi:hypothetical protein
LNDLLGRMISVMIGVIRGVILKTQAQAKTVRRSIAMPQSLEYEVRKVAREDRSNVNRTVLTALEEFLRRRRNREFQKLMDEMGSDPEIQKASSSLSKAFAAADTDGLE